MPDPVARDTVTLGSVATFVRDDGRRMTYRILEADPGAWSISYVSPVARALIGEAPGDRVVFGDREIEVLTANSTGSLAASCDFSHFGPSNLKVGRSQCMAGCRDR